MSRNVLVLCTGNSARSIFGEACFNHAAKGKWRAFSAGSKPTGIINSLAISTLEHHGMSDFEPRSKSWDEFAKAGAPRMDLVITVCDNAAAEPCPLWPGAPKTAHWPFKDPAACTGSDAEKRQKFEQIFWQIKKQVESFLRQQAEH